MLATVPAMTPDPFPELRQPIQVGTMALDHRIVVPPHGGGAGALLGSPAQFEQHCAHWLAKVDGGVQWIGGGPTFVRNPLPPGFEPTGIGAHGPGFFRHPDFVPRLGTFADRVHDAGGFLSVQMVLQGGMPLAPSHEPSGYYDHRIPHAVDLDEIAWLVREYGESAALAAEAGVDAIELHANHDDLLQWFLSPLTNHRADGYGGDPEARRRLLREVVESIRGHVGRPITLGLRLCLDEMIDGGYGLDECQRVMAAFTEEGTVDYFSLDVGSNWGAPSYIPPGSYPEAAWAPLCGQARQATDRPVVYAGRAATPETAAAVIARGDADLVAMARAIMADPQFVAKAASGRRALIRPCIGLNECIHRQTVEGLVYGCAVNPRAGRESEDDLAATDRPRRILVAGGGPAGMEAAALAAEIGHDVALWERADHLGGQFAIAARAGMNGTFSDWITWQGERLARAGVGVSLRREATVEDVVGAGVDTVIVATGARPRPLAVPGAGHPGVVQGADVLSGAAEIGSRVLVVAEDDRPAPVAVADHLAGGGHDVTLVFQTPAVAPLVGKYSMGALLARLDAGGVQLVPLTRVVGIGLPQVDLAHAYSGRRWSAGPFDSVVLSCGAVPVDGLYHDLKGRHSDVHLLGDAYAPRRVVFATRQAWDLVRTLR